MNQVLGCIRTSVGYCKFKKKNQIQQRIRHYTTITLWRLWREISTNISLSMDLVRTRDTVSLTNQTNQDGKLLPLHVMSSWVDPRGCWSISSWANWSSVEESRCKTRVFSWMIRDMQFQSLIWSCLSLTAGFEINQFKLLRFKTTTFRRPHGSHGPYGAPPQHCPSFLGRCLS